jgi:ABC-type multidrug transport system fused ATPase/permease subunit
MVSVHRRYAQHLWWSTSREARASRNLESLMHLFRNLLRLFDRRERWKLAFLSGLLFFGSLLEVVGIGLLLPFIKIVGDPNVALRHPLVGPWITRAGIVTPRAIITAACIALVALSLFKGVYVAATMRTAYKFIYDKVLALTKRLLTTYLRAPYLFHLHKNTAELVRNTTFEPEAIGGVLKFALFLPTEIIVVVGLLSVLIFTEPRAALVGISAMGTLMWAVSAYSRKELARLGAVRSQEQGRMIQAVNQSLGGIKEVQLLGRQEFFADALARCGRKYTDALRRSTLITQYPRVILETSATLLIVIFVLLIIFSGRDMKGIIGVLALFGMALVRLVPSATRITNALHGMRFYAHAVTAVADALEIEKEMRKPAANARPIEFKKSIRLDALTYRYPEAADDSLRAVDLAIPRGARIAFVGSSGAGKTTIANLVLGLLEPTSGRILVDGVDVRENIRGWQNHLGYIPQDIYLIDDTIRRNVAFGLPDDEIDDVAVWRALESAQLTPFVQALSGNLDAQVGERGVRISAGQRQRIGIARALYHDPDVLVLDEATSALDNETERLFVAAINSLTHRKTILIIAHRLSTVRDCDTIYLMRDGEVAASGTFGELVMSEPAFAQLVEGRAELQAEPV